MGRPFKELRRRIEDADMQETELAARIKRCPSCFSHRMNAHAEWDAADIRNICREVGIRQDEIGRLFFADVP